MEVIQTPKMRLIATKTSSRMNPFGDSERIRHFLGLRMALKQRLEALAVRKAED
jgi:hypothetical protein